MTTDDRTKIEIKLSDAPPVRIIDEDWPTVAKTGPNAFGAWMAVRKHCDGRTIVYGYADRPVADGHTISSAPTYAGFLLSTGDATDEEIIRSIRRVAGLIGAGRASVDATIAALPARDI